MSNELTPATIDSTIAIYTGASMLRVTEEEQNKLLADFDTSLIEIRPDGLIYLPQAFWRQRLNTTFGIGQWVLVVKNSSKDPERSKLYLQGILMIRGCYVAEAVGEAEYHEDNKNQSWASVWEAAKSDCITRCCKDLGIASQLWQPQFAQEWVSANAVKVFVEVDKWNPSTRQKEKKTATQWRKTYANPFWNEKGIAEQPKPTPPSTTPREELNKRDANRNSLGEDLSHIPDDQREYFKQHNDVEEVWQLITNATQYASLKALADRNMHLFSSNPELQKHCRNRFTELKPKAA